jgi:pimeloyl-ACP methyl ester carboxylesterase
LNFPPRDVHFYPFDERGRQDGARPPDEQAPGSIDIDAARLLAARQVLMRNPLQGEVRYLLDGAFYRMVYHEFGNPANPPVVCVHGLTRTGRDFDALGSALADRFHVICPDLPGRGGSDWLPDAMLYQPPAYVQALSHLLGMIGRKVMFIGTSLGGICGMALAATLGHSISRLVLNDVGPLIPAAAIRRIRDYMTAVRPEFADMLGLEKHLRAVHAPFGNLTDRQWEHLAITSGRVLPGGRVALHYDPGIARPIRSTYAVDVDMWRWWNQIKIPVLAIRGAQSDLFLPETLERMVRAGARSLVVPDTGHAPALMDVPSIRAVRAFLTAAEV